MQKTYNAVALMGTAKNPSSTEEGKSAVSKLAGHNDYFTIVYIANRSENPEVAMNALDTIIHAIKANRLNTAEGLASLASVMDNANSPLVHKKAVEEFRTMLKDMPRALPAIRSMNRKITYAPTLSAIIDNATYLQVKTAAIEAEKELMDWKNGFVPDTVMMNSFVKSAIGKE